MFPFFFLKNFFLQAFDKLGRSCYNIGVMRRHGCLPRAARNNGRSRFINQNTVFMNVAHRVWFAVGIYSLFFGVA